MDENKKKLDKYMVMILFAVHLDIDHIRDKLLTSHEILSIESLTTQHLRIPTLQRKDVHVPVEPLLWFLHVEEEDTMIGEDIRNMSLMHIR